MKHSSRNMVIALLVVMALALSVSAYAVVEMSPDGRSCYAAQCHEHGTVDKDLKKILKKLGDTVNDPDPSNLVATFEGTGTGSYTAGTYTSVGKGMYDLSVTMTFTENTITEIIINAPLETPSIGGVAAVSIADSILQTQGTEVDAIASATLSSDAILSAAASCIAQAQGLEEVPAA